MILATRSAASSTCRFVVDNTGIYWINNYWYWYPVAGTYGRGMIMKISPK